MRSARRPALRDGRTAGGLAGKEQPALDAGQKWIFSPGVYNGRTVDTIFDLTVTFQIE